MEELPTNKHLLIVDDEEKMRTTLESSLKKEGYDITCASNGNEALTVLKTRGISLVLMDIQMPGMDGIKLLETIRREGYPVPVIILTGYGDVDVYIKGKELGAAEFINKPVRLPILKKAIKSALNN